MSAQETYDYLMDVRLRIQHCIIPNDLFYLKKAAVCPPFPPFSERR